MEELNNVFTETVRIPEADGARKKLEQAKLENKIKSILSDAVCINEAYEEAIKRRDSKAVVAIFNENIDFVCSFLKRKGFKVEFKNNDLKGYSFTNITFCW